MPDTLKRILVVDDDTSARLLMRAALRKAGYEVGLASGGAQALELFAQQGFDLVLLDVEMPDMNGHEVCRILRTRVGDMLPVVMVTGLEDTESVERAYHAGATDFIAKPVNWALIGHRVRYLLRSYAAMLALRAAEKSISQLAYSDTLTGLPNRLSFMERLQWNIQRAANNGQRLALLFMDLDGFKGINDSLGHAAGDQVLRVAAERLRECLRPADVVARASGVAHDVELARLGGDEFTALLLDIHHADDAMHVAMRINQVMRQPFTLDTGPVQLSASIGMALFPDDGSDGSSLLKHADAAMYQAKRGGRNSALRYTPGLVFRPGPLGLAGARARSDAEPDVEPNDPQP